MDFLSDSLALKASSRPISLKYTKLFTSLSWLILISQFFFVAHANVHPEPTYRIRGSRRDGDEPTFEDDADANADFQDIPMVPVSGEIDAHVEGPPDDFQREIIRAIAQDLFHHPTERNFFESNWQDYFKQWSVDALPRYRAYQDARPGVHVSQTEFFAIDTLGWEGMKCGRAYNGCQNMPTPEHVRARYPEERHRARQIIFTLEAISKSYSEVQVYAQALLAAKTRMAGYCREFASVFFHDQTDRKHVSCVGEIIGLVIAALVGIVFAGTMLVMHVIALLNLLYFSITRLGYMAFAGAGGIAVKRGDSSEGPSDDHAAALGVIGEFPMDHVAGMMSAIDELEEDSAVRTTQHVFDKAVTPPSALGTFGLSEWFPVRDLNTLPSADPTGSSLYDRIEVRSESWFRRQPQSTQDSSSRSEKLHDRDSTQTALRMTSLFTIHQIDDPRGAYSQSMSPAWDLGSRVSSRLQHANGTSMDVQDALSFLERHQQEIRAYSTNLRKLDVEFPDTDVPISRPSSEPNFRIRVQFDHLPWTNVLGDYKFEGTSSTGKLDQAIPELRWKSKPLKVSSTQSKKNRRDEVVVVVTEEEVQTHPVIVHDIVGMTNSLQALGLAMPHQGMKRSNGDGWYVTREYTGEDNLFSVQMDSVYFRNEIKQEECGDDNYTGDMSKNIEACHRYLDGVFNRVAGNMLIAVDALEDPSQLKEGSPWPIAIHAQKRFSTFSMFTSTRRLEGNQAAAEDALFTSLKNSLVSKAYADEQCYLKCTSNEYTFAPDGHSKHHFDNHICMTGCFDPTQQRFESLYGLAGQPGTNMAERAPWNLSEAQIAKVSYEAYQNRDPSGYLPGSINLNPYVKSVKDDTPILPVCQSDYLAISPHNVEYREDYGEFPCSCGDKYGSESELFWSASSWAGYSKYSEYQDIKDCLEGPLDKLSYNNPAAYVINMCKVVYRGVAPPGVGSHQEEEDKGHYSENYRACQVYWKFYEANRGQSDAFLDENICKLWSRYSKDWSRGGIHSLPDMSYVNDALEDRGCHEYRHFWDDDCDEGEDMYKCGWPAGW